jgi:hypothetical protein
VLPLLLRRVHVERCTGLLHIRRGLERGSFCFVRGELAWGDTNLEECRMGECLVRHGRLTEGDLVRASLLVGATGRRLGEVLMETGVFDEDGLDDGLALHVREILLTVFTWSDGSWELEEPIPEGLRGYSKPLKLSTPEVILDAVWSLPDPTAVSFGLGNLERPLIATEDERLRSQVMSLTPEDGFILSRVDGTASAREVLEISGLDRAEAERRLFGLLCTGVIDYALPKVRQMAAPRHTEKPVVPIIRLSVGPEPEPELVPLARAPEAVASEAFMPAESEAEAVDESGPHARLRQARLLLKDPGRRKHAERELRFLLAEDPRCAEAYYLLGIIAQEHDAGMRAQTLFRKALELDPRHAAAAAELEGKDRSTELPRFLRRFLSR